MRAVALALALLAAAPAAAQEPRGFTLSRDLAGPSVLVVDQEALWSGSAWGRRVERDAAARLAELSAENERIAAELEAEDSALTEARKTLAPEDFRARADAFDAQVTQLRADRDAAAQAFRDGLAAERAGFVRAALPVLAAEMEARGAEVLVDRQQVIMSAESVDVTAAMVAAVDAALGAGPGPVEAPAAPSPVPSATPAP